MRGEFLQKLGRLHLDGRLAALRESAKSGLDPTAADETLNFLLALVRMKQPRRMLEIGSAEGLTSIALLSECPSSQLVAIESDELRFSRAKENFVSFGVADRVTSLFGDAAQILPSLQGEFELIFLDGPKAQYVHYLPHLKRLLASGGALVADDVLLYGWVSGEVPPPPKRRSIAERLREYLEAVSADPDLITSVLELGEGVAFSVKR